jgi:hypothetical protein
MSLCLQLQHKGDFIWYLEGTTNKKVALQVVYTGSICKGEKPGRQPVTEAQVDTVHASFVCSPCKSMRHAA